MSDLVWSAPARPFKKRDKEFFTTIAAIVFLLSVILFFAKEWLLIGVIIALMFAVYTLSTIPPETVEHQVTKDGLKTNGQFFTWEEMVDFWFGEQWGEKLLFVRTKKKLPGTLIVLLSGTKETEVKTAFGDKIAFREAPFTTWLDRAGEWLSQKIPLDR